jgi:uncharacterized protein
VSAGGHIPTLDTLRRFAVARSLFAAADLQNAIDTFGFVQADPIRAPARAQDLTLRHRVAGYRAGDLERRYGSLRVEEDVFINYGFITPRLYALMHPRSASGLPRGRRARAESILAFVRERGTVHPREVEQQFALGRVTNYWGGSSTATTHLLEAMHYLGLLRVVRREAGVRVYGARNPREDDGESVHPDAKLDSLVDVIVRKYAPMPASSLSTVVRRLQYGTPQWRRRILRAIERAKKRLPHTKVDGVEYYWPGEESLTNREPEDAVRLLAPFDPVVWDRKRFELLWGWAYRFEAYTPVAKRKLGYYALPLLWRDRVIGWANAVGKTGSLSLDFGYVAGRAPKDRVFARELEAEVERLREFLGAQV